MKLTIMLAAMAISSLATAQSIPMTASMADFGGHTPMAGMTDPVTFNGPNHTVSIMGNTASTDAAALASRHYQNMRSRESDYDSSTIADASEPNGNSVALTDERCPGIGTGYIAIEFDKNGLTVIDGDREPTLGCWVGTRTAIHIAWVYGGAYSYSYESFSVDTMGKKLLAQK